jgi:cytochrome c oxidase assembly factor CtaG
LAGTALGAAMSLAAHPWYSAYALSDQQFAGVIMWMVAGFVQVGVAFVLIGRWLRADELVAA